MGLKGKGIGLGIGLGVAHLGPLHRMDSNCIYSGTGLVGWLAEGRVSEHISRPSHPGGVSGRGLTFWLMLWDVFLHVDYFRYLLVVVELRLIHVLFSLTLHLLFLFHDIISLLFNTLAPH